MSTKMGTFLFSLVVLGLAQESCGGREQSTSSGTGSPPPTIAVIPKGTTHEFWKSVHAGSREDSRRLKLSG